MKLLHSLKVVVEAVCGREILVLRKPKITIKRHPKAVTTGDSMFRYAKLVAKFCDYSPSNIFEVGANYGQDSEFLRKSFSLKNSDVYVFEPHPQILPEVKRYYNFNCFDFAVSNKDGSATFNVVDVSTEQNTGISSLKTSLSLAPDRFKSVTVQTKRMDTFLREQTIETIDFLKIDVEGANYEVLESFGEELSKVKAIQVEGENKPYWEGQKLFADIYDLLQKNGFVMVDYVLSGDAVQSDSFWIQEKHLKPADE